MRLNNKRLRLIHNNHNGSKKIVVGKEITGVITDACFRNLGLGKCRFTLTVRGNSYEIPYEIPARIGERVILHYFTPGHTEGIQLLNEKGEVTYRYYFTNGGYQKFVE